MSCSRRNRLQLRRAGRGAAGRGPGRHERRGVLLLVVLSMLVLFAVVGVTFALVSSQFRRASLALPRIDRYTVSFRDQLDDAAKQVFRGSNDPLSALTIHSLLEDMYGSDGLVNTYLPGSTIANPLVAKITANTLPPNNNVNYAQLTDIFLTFAAPNGTVAGQYVPSPVTQNVLPGPAIYGGPAPSGFFNGCVLTMTTGPLAGRSTRIVGYDSGTGPGTTGVCTLRVVAFGFPYQLSSGVYVYNSNYSALSPLANNDFVINGRPFNGVGFGLDTSGAVTPPNSIPYLVNAKDANGRLFALLPNTKYFAANGAYTVAGGVGGADEDYDAADWNNMLLGLVTSPAGGPYPSLHRPELVNYWMQKTSAASMSAMNATLLRQIMLRPSPLDHPNFTGSNPASTFDPVNGPWDVDTDGDGVTDSVWVDLGFPVQTAPDGTTYKPLFAIRCLDLDGRLNVNAHGNSSHTETARQTNPPAAISTPYAPFAAEVASITPNTGTVQLGSGYGPAEINLQMLFAQNPSVNSLLQYYYLMAGVPNTGPEGRYGESNYLITSGTASSTNYASNYPYSSTNMGPAGAIPITSTSASATAPPYPGLTPHGSTYPTNPLGIIKHFELPLPGSPGVPTAYGSPPDLYGRGFVALGLSGAPMTPNMSAAPTGQYDSLNNPYMFNLSRKAVRQPLTEGAVDNPFSLAELERILRTYDMDAMSLPQRLATLFDPSSAPPASNSTPATPLGTILAKLRNQVTTESWDLPSPNLMATQDMRSGITKSSGIGTVQVSLAFHAADLLAARLIANSALTGTALQTFVQTQLQLMMPPDLMNGLRYNINRPFGNARDDNGDGVVDDYIEYGSGEPAWTSLYASGINLAIDYNYDGVVNQTDALAARYAMARYLYVLAMTLVDQNRIAANQGLVYGNKGVYYDGNSSNPYQLQFALAQWAVNAVDFRDRDAAMTPFEFDVNPFNGWQPDGNLATTADTDPTVTLTVPQTIVWGVERPELLITETLAWHDRRSEDLSSTSTPVGPGGGNKTTGDTPADGDFDQRLVPIPAAFVELYNPWVTQYSTLNNGTGGAGTAYAPSSAEVPGEFYYDANNTNHALWPYTAANPPAGTTPNPPIGVVLNKLDPSGNSPVWRLAFSPTISDPDDPVAYPPAAPATYDRVVYFVNPPAAFADASATVKYYTSQPVSPLKPGRYAVVGSANQLMPAANALPGGVTTATNVYVSKVGRTLLPSAATDSAPQTINTRRIVLAPDPNGNADNNQFWVLKSGETPVSPLPGQGEPTLITATGTGDAQPVVAIAVDQAVGYTAGAPNGYPYGRSFGISDPVGGYAALAAGLATPSTIIPLSGNSEEETSFSPPLSSPADNGTAMVPAVITNSNTTTQNYHYVFLQRLANPQLPWNATTNPYRTIDTMTMDLTIFNGVWPTTAVTVPLSKPADPSLVAPAAGQTYKFVSNAARRPICADESARRAAPVACEFEPEQSAVGSRAAASRGGRIERRCRAGCGGRHYRNAHLQLQPVALARLPESASRVDLDDGGHALADQQHRATVRQLLHFRHVATGPVAALHRRLDRQRQQSRRPDQSADLPLADLEQPALRQPPGIGPGAQESFVATALRLHDVHAEWGAGYSAAIQHSGRGDSERNGSAVCLLRSSIEFLRCQQYIRRTEHEPVSHFRVSPGALEIRGQRDHFKSNLLYEFAGDLDERLQRDRLWDVFAAPLQQDFRVSRSGQAEHQYGYRPGGLAGIFRKQYQPQSAGDRRRHRRRGVEPTRICFGFRHLPELFCQPLSLVRRGRFDQLDLFRQQPDIGAAAAARHRCDSFEAGFRR